MAAAKGKARARRRQTWAALLRGVNLGSRNKISMPHLRELFDELGCDDVTTYLQSGNFLFRSAVPRDELTQSF